jgi:hypothetical protein
MTRAASLLSAAGIEPGQGAAEAAALMVRRLPLRINGRPQTSPEAAVENGWCSGLEAFAEIIATVTTAPCRSGTAFGGWWPWFDVGGQIVAPGLPVRLADGTEDAGPDGVYSVNRGRVWREAVGRQEVFLHTEASNSTNQPEFSLLWFSETARFLLRGAVLEIEDLFSKTLCAADKVHLEHILVRAGRVDESVLEGLSFEGDPQPTVVEVSRGLGSAKTPWREPAAFLESRIDVERATVRGDRIVIKDVRSESVEFLVTTQETGWTLERREGNFPLEVLRLHKEDESLVLRATLAPEHDIFSPGLRGRVVFDLNADLASWAPAAP